MEGDNEDEEEDEEHEEEDEEEEITRGSAPVTIAPGGVKVEGEL